MYSKSAKSLVICPNGRTSKLVFRLVECNSNIGATRCQRHRREINNVRPVGGRLFSRVRSGGGGGGRGMPSRPRGDELYFNVTLFLESINTGRTVEQDELAMKVISKTTTTTTTLSGFMCKRAYGLRAW